MRAWLKGGLILGGIGFVIAIIGMIGIIFCGWNFIETTGIPEGICKSPIILVYYPIIPIILSFYYFIHIEGAFFNSFSFLVLNIIIITFVSFLLGALIGFIIGRFKSRNQEVER